VEKPEGKNIRRRLGRLWVHRVKMVLRERGWCDMDRINLAQNGDQWRDLVNKVIKFSVP
jgi:hypothetical protein